MTLPVSGPQARSGVTAARSWLEDEIQAGRLSETIDDADLVAIAGVLVKAQNNRIAPAARPRRSQEARHDRAATG